MKSSKLFELALMFLKLGATAFGGPAAHIALMEQEFVARREWLTHQEFLDLIGATNLIPGPNSTELAMHLGYRRAGWQGLIVAGVCFILPAALMVLGLAWLYSRYNTVPQMRWLFSGVQPVVVAIIAFALWKLARTAIKTFSTFIIVVAVSILALLGINEVALIFAAALCGLLAAFTSKTGSTPRHPSQNEKTDAKKTEEEPVDRAPALFIVGGILALGPSLMQIFWTFLKIGSVVYGSGYVLLAFLRAEFVENTHWISNRQLLDAVAVGQFTPGPLFTSATFIGFLIGGTPGAVAATIGIFLPAFVFVALLSVGLERLQTSPRARVFLDIVNAASVALMFVVTVELAQAAIADAGVLFAPLVFAVALGLLYLTSINSLWLMLAGAGAGYLAHVLK